MDNLELDLLVSIIEISLTIDSKYNILAFWCIIRFPGFNGVLPYSAFVTHSVSTEHYLRVRPDIWNMYGPSVDIMSTSTGTRDHNSGNRSKLA